MNKKLICLLMFVFSLSLAFTACSDDDDDNDKVDYAKEIAATYGGTLSIPGLGAQPITMNKDIILTRVAENKSKVELKDLSIPLGEGSFPVGNITVDNVEVSKSGDTYTLKETVTTVKVPAIDGSGLVNAGVKLSGTVKNNKLDLKIDVTDVPVVSTLNITFSGTKK